MRLPYVPRTETPIGDRLYDITQGNRLATFHGQPGGEWDVLRHAPLKRRQRLTGAGWMGLHGVAPDVFADLIRRYGPQDAEADPIGWYLREAELATRERRAARHRDVMAAIAKRAEVSNYYEYRQRQARAAGFDTFWAYRKARGWQ